ncbi:MAG: proton-conducting transporter membrane subunit [Nitrospira sp.]|nr:proton-conducting transporter membrane subunit [Nitrospira sp.]
MTGGALIPWLLAGLPLLGALACLPFRSESERLKQSSVAWAVVSLASVAGCAGLIDAPPEGLLPLYLLPLAATISILGQPVHEQHRLSWILTLVCLGLGLSALSSPQPIAPLSVTLLLALIAGLLYRHHSALWPRSWWGIGAYGFGAFCAAASVAADVPLSSVASLLACAVLLPLVPFHDGYLTALTRLPGSLPSFIVVLLPVAGLHQLAAALPTIPDTVAWTVSLFALVGASYGALKALAQSRVRLLLAYGSLSFLSIFWWFAAASRTTTPRAALLVGAVGLATSGLMIGWQVVRTRYGDDVDPQAISGLASGMPHYAVLLSLIALAAMGLPPFGVFAGFMGLLLNSPLPSLAGLFVTLLAWLAASWYIMQLVQRLLFGVQRPELRYTDLLHAELASLLIIVLVLLALGLAPSTLFASDQAWLGTSTIGELTTWNR